MLGSVVRSNTSRLTENAKVNEANNTALHHNTQCGGVQTSPTYTPVGARQPRTEASQQALCQPHGSKAPFRRVQVCRVAGLWGCAQQGRAGVAGLDQLAVVCRQACCMGCQVTCLPAGTHNRTNVLDTHICLRQAYLLF